MSIYTCNECNDAAFQHLNKQMEKKFHLTPEEVEYFVKNLQHEYLGKDSYYMAVDILRRMESFLKEQAH
jgi:hypothetical protein